MLDLQPFANGKMTMEENLNEYGLSGGIISKYADNGLRNINFLVIMGWITEDEAQTILNRIIARIGRGL